MTIPFIQISRFSPKEHHGIVIASFDIPGGPKADFSSTKAAYKLLDELEAKKDGFDYYFSYLPISQKYPIGTKIWWPPWEGKN